ncbi:hypothetical protein H0A36_14570 [Endozoicomonas sp. SM1973]|uniref:Uncharacterized protein n=1 Tax=Spartinivicinus marinus TaxID=2994442 RepID=A0A853I3N9_9GAMM|nr:hypothetical protein [Spartinivicinus marinus]MCX4028572.1 hypothetical protein [Spartinivicinus marinus]NYZ67239.1 hypothetical protein [Spartinivicinus marinus]
MSLNEPIKAVNDTPDKTVDVVCNCDFLWSLAQLFCILRLSDKAGKNEYDLINLYTARAKRIAATYARFYLETEEGGDPAKLGRYYWMALGAFASKTVFCFLDTIQVKGAYAIFIKSIGNSLGKGNLWLFMDIAASHWLYNNYPEHFHKGMQCERKRNANQLEQAVKAMTYDLPWAEEAIDKINNFQPSSDIVKGFKLIKSIEKIKNKNKVPNLQLGSLLAIAEHEQGTVLQPLIYNNPDFSKWARRERDWFRWAAPTYQLVFAHTCETDAPELKSVAPNDLIVEDFDSRMHWIGNAAKKFHKLMLQQNTHMIQELQTIANWVNEPDADIVY